jgi:serine/threonine protein kinase
MQDLYIRALESIEHRIIDANFTKKHPLLKPLQNGILSLKTIREHNSSSPYYEIVYNQSVVLLVSYFESTLEDLFINILSIKISDGTLNYPTNKIKLNLKELCELITNHENIPKVWLSQNEINFQNINHAEATFKDYFGILSCGDKHIDNIKMGALCRHIIVHSGEIISQNNVEAAKKIIHRDIMGKFTAGDKIRFEPEEITKICESMETYIDNIIKQIKVM